jgi:hypothetical protein
VIIGLVGVLAAVGSGDSPQPAARAQVAAMVITVVAKRIRHSPISALTHRVRGFGHGGHIQRNSKVVFNTEHRSLTCEDFSKP